MSALGLAELKDPPLLAALREKLIEVDWVLLTGDDNMPAEHPTHLTGLTVATVDGRWEGKGLEQEDWKWETCQRWAHYMADRQAPATIRRYSPKATRLWTPRL